MIFITAQQKEAQAIKRIMQGLHCSEEEAREIAKSDIAIDRNEAQDFDLPPEKQKIAQKFAHTGTRKTPTVYKFNTPKRKPNATKEGLIAEISQLLESLSFDIKDIQITNVNRQITFQVGEDTFDLTLIQKRKKKGE